LGVAPEYLAPAVRDGYTLKEMKLVHRLVGDSLLPPGRVSCDPFVCPETEPFSSGFPRRRFPIVLVIAEIAADQRVAFALINVSPAVPARWEMLTIGKHDVATLKYGEIFGYPVDSGTGCFMDLSASRSLIETMNKMRSITKNRLQRWTKRIGIPGVGPAPDWATPT
jgi:hypothetical protein